MTAVQRPSWLRHPLAEALLRFNLLPSLLLHAGRGDAQSQAGLKALPALHRHQSAALLKQHGLEPVLGLDDPALPLAMLPGPHFDKLLLLLGAALNAPHIRRTIARDEVSLLRNVLGPQTMAMARSSAAAALAGLPVAPDWTAANAADLCTAWGAAVLAQAFDAAAPAVGRRARLRLDPEADALRAPLSAAGLQPERALGIARDVLQTLEPAWLSSFPASR
ncbi:MAG: SctK family type III secretion system sorting platform protein [Ramlibacter sp.]